MELKNFIQHFSQSGGMDNIPVADGIYQIPMNGFTIRAFMQGKNICIEADLAKLPDIEDEKQRFAEALTRAMSQVISYSACLSISPDRKFMLHERMDLEELTAGDFIAHIKKFGAVYLHLSRKMQSV